MTNDGRDLLTKVPARHAGLLDHQDRRHHAGRDRRRHGHDDDGASAISIGTAIFGATLVLLVWWQIAAERFHP